MYNVSMMSKTNTETTTMKILLATIALAVALNGCGTASPRFTKIQESTYSDTVDQTVVMMDQTTGRPCVGYLAREALLPPGVNMCSDEIKLETK